ncbi:hypothetical protein Tco_0098152 [Tanacetum coccineum]
MLSPVSGLMLKLHKSNLYFVGVNSDDVRNFSYIKRLKSHGAFIFMGLPIALLGIDGSTALGYGSGRGPLQESISDTNSFSIKGTHVHIDNFMLPDVHSPTRWIRCILKKVNIMIWRALRDRLPTCWNLSRKASEIWHKVFMWLDHLFPVINSFATIFEWVEDLRINSQAKHIVQSIWVSTLLSI